MLGNEIELTLVLMKDTAKIDHNSDPQEKSPMYIRVLGKVIRDIPAYQGSSMEEGLYSWRRISQVLFTSYFL